MNAASSLVLGAGTETGVVLDLILVLGAAAFAVLVLARLGVSAIAALILTGAFIGPHALEWVPAPDALGVIAHLAIVVLLFGVGLELHLDALRPGATRLILAGVGACVACTALLWPVAAQFTSSAAEALVIAMAFCLSSTAVVLKYFTSRRELTLPAGRLALAILVIQDLAVIGMLALVPMLGRWAGVEAVEDGPGAFDDVGDIVLRLGGVVALVLVGRLLLPKLLRESLRVGGTEALFLAGMAFALGAAGACEGLGFSLELGAFLAGFILADTPFQQELSGKVVPVRDLFLAVFFTTLGMNVDPAVALDVWPWVLVAVAALVVVKLIAIGIACWSGGAHASTALIVGACLAHGGEFSLVLLEQAQVKGVLDARMHGILIVVVVVGLLLMPALGALARRIAPHMHAAPLAPFAGRTRLARPFGQTDEDAVPARVIVAGYGPVGRAVVEAMEAAGLPTAVIELNPATITELRSQGRFAVLGDVRTSTVLSAAGIEKALALIVTMPDVQAARVGVSSARRMNPAVWTAARAPLVQSKKALLDAGVDLVLSDEDSMADRLPGAILARLVESSEWPT